MRPPREKGDSRRGCAGNARRGKRQTLPAGRDKAAHSCRTAAPGSLRHVFKKTFFCSRLSKAELHPPACFVNEIKYPQFQHLASARKKKFSGRPRNAPGRRPVPSPFPDFCDLPAARAGRPAPCPHARRAGPRAVSGWRYGGKSRGRGAIFPRPVQRPACQRPRGHERDGFGPRPGAGNAFWLSAVRRSSPASSGRGW